MNLVKRLDLAASRGQAAWQLGDRRGNSNEILMEQTLRRMVEESKIISFNSTLSGARYEKKKMDNGKTLFP